MPKLLWFAAATAWSQPDLQVKPPRLKLGESLGQAVGLVREGGVHLPIVRCAHVTVNEGDWWRLRFAVNLGVKNVCKVNFGVRVSPRANTIRGKSDVGRMLPQ